jgi:hypothetical protein
VRKKYKAKHIPDFSVVRSPGGRLGYITHNTDSGKPQVILPAPDDTSGVEVEASTELEVIRYPGELARLWVLAHSKEGEMLDWFEKGVSDFWCPVGSHRVVLQDGQWHCLGRV